MDADESGPGGSHVAVCITAEQEKVLTESLQLLCDSLMKRMLLVLCNVLHEFYFPGLC